MVKLSTIQTNGLLVLKKTCPWWCYPELAKWQTKVNDQLWIQNESLKVILWREYLNICLKICFNQKWNKILFYLTVYIENIQWTVISTRSEYVVDIWVPIRNNQKMLISRLIVWNQLLVVARGINKQNDCTKLMFSITVIVTWLFNNVSTYPELGQIRNWRNYFNSNLTYISKTSKISKFYMLLKWFQTTSKIWYY